MWLAADSCRARDSFVRTVGGALSSAFVESGSVAEAFSNVVDQFPARRRGEIYDLFPESPKKNVFRRGSYPLRDASSRGFDSCVVHKAVDKLEGMGFLKNNRKCNAETRRDGGRRRRGI